MSTSTTSIPKLVGMSFDYDHLRTVEEFLRDHLEYSGIRTRRAPNHSLERHVDCLYQQLHKVNPNPDLCLTHQTPTNQHENKQNRPRRSERSYSNNRARNTQQNRNQPPVNNNNRTPHPSSRQQHQKTEAEHRDNDNRSRPRHTTSHHAPPRERDYSSRQQRRTTESQSNNTNIHRNDQNGRHTRDHKKNPEDDSHRAVARDVFRYIQLNHHRKNWETTPSTITRDIWKITDNINPPAPDEQLKNDLHGITHIFIKSIEEVVQNHMDRKLTATREKLRDTHRPLDTSIVNRMTRSYCKNTLGERLNQNYRDAVYEEALLFTRPPISSTPTGSTHNPDAMDTTPPQDPPNREPTTSIHSNNTPPPNTQSPSHTSTLQVQIRPKRTLDEVQSPATPTMAKRPQRDQTDLIENDPSSTHPDSPRRQFLYKTRSLTNGEWNLEIKGEPHTIIIGDSNAKNLPTPPPGWQTHCFPGLHIDEVKNLLSKIPPNTSIRHIILHVGINDRAQHLTELPQPLTDAVLELIDHRKIEVHAVSVPAGDRLRESDKLNTEHLNQLLRDFFHSYFIQPVLGENFISEGDPNHIHLTMEAAQETLIEMIRHIEGLNYMHHDPYGSPPYQTSP